VLGVGGEVATSPTPNPLPEASCPKGDMGGLISNPALLWLLCAAPILTVVLLSRLNFSPAEKMAFLLSVNWTSTTVPMWQIDCESFRKVGGIFQLKDVSTEEHHLFITHFCARHGYKFTMAGTTAIFSAATSKTED
jgi:hypothetical protein